LVGGLDDIFEGIDFKKEGYSEVGNGIAGSDQAKRTGEHRDDRLFSSRHSASGVMESPLTY